MKEERLYMKNRINDKIIQIEKFLEELYDNIPSNIDLEEYKRDIKTKAICERYFEKIVEAIVDLAFLVIKLKKFRIPEDDENSFIILEQNKIISQDLCFNLRKAKGMRNVIAHQYGIIDDEKGFLAIKDQLEEDTKEFIKSIELTLTC